MTQIEALVNTVAKKAPKNSVNLPSGDKTSIRAGWICPVKKVTDHPTTNHWEVELEYSAGTWFFYKPHVVITDATPLPSTASLVERVLACCERRGYRLARGDREITIIGIEGIKLNGTPNGDPPNSFNDVVGILDFNNGAPQFDVLCKATTEPGSHFTNNPNNGTDAVARLDTGFHSKLWQIGLHRGYEALVQGDNVARLVRDRNRNFLRDDPVSHEQYRGINLHTTKTTGGIGSATPGNIGLWSAGCVVIFEPNEFVKFITRVKQSQQFQQNRYHDFDFILIWSKWLEQGITPQTAAVSASSQDIDVMARTIWGEARGESFNGKVAVAWVIRNRMSRSPKFSWPNSIAQVCQQPAQFSCWNLNDPNYSALTSVNASSSTFRECLEIAKKVVKGELSDLSSGADHYFANYISTPQWARGRTPAASLGVHHFYKL